MKDSDQSGRLSSKDERAAQKFFQIIGQDEVPYSVHKNVGALDLTVRHTASIQPIQQEVSEEQPVR